RLVAADRGWELGAVPLELDLAHSRHGEESRGRLGLLCAHLPQRRIAEHDEGGHSFAIRDLLAPLPKLVEPFGIPTVGRETALPRAHLISSRGAGASDCSAAT